MDKKQGVVIRAVKILFLISFLLAGCTTTPKAVSPKAAAKQETPKQEIKKKFLDDILVFLDLQQVDLDKDGKKEVVAIYAAGSKSSGVRVIKFSKDKGDVIFERIFNTPNTKFEVRKGIPTIISEEIDYTSGRRLKNTYHWDGKAFILESK